MLKFVKIDADQSGMINQLKQLRNDLMKNLNSRGKMI